MRKIVVHTAFAIITSSYLIWSSVNAEETLSATQSPEAVEEAPTQSFLSSVSDTHFEKDFSASVGVKMWMNQWNLPATVSPEDNGQKLTMSFTSGTETTLIPVVSVRTKNWFVSGSYFTKTEYGFAKQSLDFPFYIPFDGTTNFIDEIDENGDGVEDDWEEVEVNDPVMLKYPLDILVKNDRTEWDINVGYYLHKYLLVTAGYKRIERDYETTGEIPKYEITTFDENDTPSTKPSTEIFPNGGKFRVSTRSKSSGPTLGIASVVPLQGRFGLYGNFAFGRLDTTVEGNETNRTTDYYLGDMGLFYSFKFAKVVDAATVSLGYRFQSLYFEADNGLDVRDGTEGFALSLNVTF